MVCPGFTTFSSARLCRISLTAFSHREVPVEGSSPPRLPPCFPSSSSSSCSAPVSLRPVRKSKMFPLTHSFSFLHLLYVMHKSPEKSMKTWLPSFWHLNPKLLLFKAHALYFSLCVSHNCSPVPQNYSFTVEITLITGSTGNHPPALSDDVTVVITGMFALRPIWNNGSMRPQKTHKSFVLSLQSVHMSV